MRCLMLSQSRFDLTGCGSFWDAFGVLNPTGKLKSESPFGLGAKWIIFIIRHHALSMFGSLERIGIISNLLYCLKLLDWGLKSLA